MSHYNITQAPNNRDFIYPIKLQHDEKKRELSIMFLKRIFFAIILLNILFQNIIKNIIFCKFFSAFSKNKYNQYEIQHVTK